MGSRTVRTPWTRVWGRPLEGPVPQRRPLLSALVNHRHQVGSTALGVRSTGLVHGQQGPHGGEELEERLGGTKWMSSTDG